MKPTDWIMVGIVGAGMVGKVFLWIDAWVHSRANSETNQVKDLAQVIRDVASLRTMFDRANGKWSEELSRWQERIGANHTALRVLEEHAKAVDRQLQALERHLGKITNGD